VGEDFIFIQFDFKSFYDQFVLAFNIRKYFGILGHDDLFYNLILLPMGFRLAVAMAQSVMWFLLNFKKAESVGTATCIDNVCFSGKRGEVFQAATSFLLRVEKCGFTLNGMEDICFTKLNNNEREKFLRSLEEKEPEFLGEKYNLIKETRALTNKTVSKLDVVWGVVGHSLGSSNYKITHRQFYCLIGIMIFATEVLNINTCKYYNFFKRIRKLSGLLNKEEHLWDKPLELHLTKLEHTLLEEWVGIIRKNEPVPLTIGKKEGPSLAELQAELYIVVDASNWGWGALFYNRERVYTDFMAEQWPRGDYRSSVKAEPLGIEEVVKRARGRIRNKKVAILTDHENLTFASRSLFINSFTYNKCISCLEKISKQEKTEFFIFYVEGEKNNADGVPRGATNPKDTSFPDVGAGFSCAQPLPWQL